MEMLEHPIQKGIQLLYKLLAAMGKISSQGSIISKSYFPKCYIKMELLLPTVRSENFRHQPLGKRVQICLEHLHTVTAIRDGSGTFFGWLLSQKKFAQVFFRSYFPLNITWVRKKPCPHLEFVSWPDPFLIQTAIDSTKKRELILQFHKVG